MDEPTRRLPALEPSKNACHSPHVVLLGAGASLAAIPEGDPNGRHVPVMSNFVDVIGLGPVLDDLGVPWSGRNFEEVFSELLDTKGTEERVREIEGIIYDYFANLRLPERVTLYDELILSLRDKDLIATFNWDPFLLEAYRRNSGVRRLPRIIFLHGNVSVGACVTHRCKGPVGTFCSMCGAPLSPVRLLYPVTQKNYQDSFIAAEWAEFSRFLEHAYLFTIFGYGAPDADVEAQRIMREVWDSNRTRELAQISIIDIRPEDELRVTWRPFFVGNHYSVSSSIDYSQLFTHPRRSCDAFAMASLQQRPCHDNPLPRVGSLHELHDFILPLVEEEEDQEARGTPFRC